MKLNLFENNIYKTKTTNQPDIRISSYQIPKQIECILQDKMQIYFQTIVNKKYKNTMFQPYQRQLTSKAQRGHYHLQDHIQIKIPHKPLNLKPTLKINILNMQKPKKNVILNTEKYTPTQHQNRSFKFHSKEIFQQPKKRIQSANSSLKNGSKSYIKSKNHMFDSIEAWNYKDSDSNTIIQQY